MYRGCFLKQALERISAKIHLEVLCKVDIFLVMTT